MMSLVDRLNARASVEMDLETARDVYAAARDRYARLQGQTTCDRPTLEAARAAYEVAAERMWIASGVIV
jgi:hypothetical protein